MKPEIYKGRVERIEGEVAVIRLDDNTEVLWPAKNLTPKAAKGVKVQFTVSLDLAEEAEQKTDQPATAMLNDILNVSKDQPE
ncbi:hypothetical protein KJ840_02840 [Patescibacteria group bacterium]|nr:hypothetical protein [Patescibacteria group bacterium]